MGTHRPQRPTQQERSGFVSDLRGVVRELSGERAMFMKENVPHVKRLDELITAAAKLGITEAKGLTLFQCETLPMRIANTMLVRGSTRADVEMLLHQLLVSLGLEHQYLEVMWGDPRQLHEQEEGQQ
ncbi:MAG: hypothetical protein RL681_334 [Candidatus Parcubacteria bacterium]|jgi:hypothetical protein